MNIELNPDEILVLRELVEGRIATLKSHNVPIAQTQTLQDTGKGSTNATNLSNAKILLKKINSSINK